MLLRASDIGISNFLNNADVDGKALPPAGAPNIMMAAGGTQLKKVFEADTIDVWQFHVDWKNPANTKVSGPEKIAVAPYHYLCDGQLTSCVPQPGTDRRLDAQGDKIMQRLVYRRIGNRESIVAVQGCGELFDENRRLPSARLPGAVSRRFRAVRSAPPLLGDSRRRRATARCARGSIDGRRSGG